MEEDRLIIMTSEDVCVGVMISCCDGWTRIEKIPNISIKR